MTSARYDLPNGMRLIVRRNTISPSATFRFCLQTGSVHDPAGKEGLALAVGQMLDEGTRTRTGKEIAERIDFLGAETDVAVDKHSTILIASVLKEHLGEVLALAAESVLEPSFPRKELERVKGEMLVGIREEEHDTRAVAMKALVRLLYPPRHPYRRSGGGTRASVLSLERADLVRFHRARFHPRGSILVVVGDVRPEDVRRFAARLFGKWTKDGDPGPPPVPDPPLPRGPKSRTLFVPEKTQCDIALGFLGIRRTDPDFPRVAVMNQILGAFGLGGRLGNRIREKEGFAYGVRSTVAASVGAGPLVVHAGVRPDHVAPAIRIMREEFERMRRERVRASELQETKDFLIGSLPLRLETNDGTASFLLAEEYYGLGPNYLERYRREIAAVTRDDVRAAARRLLRTDSIRFAVAGPPLPREAARVLQLDGYSSKR
ncbi:MAG: insulinase family protein [Candidatus Eisenbacteria bacterium]|nr:insulinase family protein [Candidatus Eisenbacteria bacterium]